MVKVLLFGATGFLGSAIARVIRSRGHRVYGLVRSPAKAGQLLQEEIIPVVGSAESTETWTSVVEKIHIDVIVDASGVMQGAEVILKTCAAISEKRIQKYGGGHGKVAKLGFIYISGIWVQGDSKAYSNDLLPVGPDAAAKPPAMVGWRVDLEHEVLRQSEVLNAVILRAGLMFGGSGSFIGALWWGPIQEAIVSKRKTVELGAKEDSVLALVHRDDVAKAVVQTIEKIETISQISYPIFSLAACNESLSQVNNLAAQFLASSAGAVSPPSITYRGPANDLEEAMTSSSSNSSDRARDLIGWTPSHTTFLGDLEIYVESFKAATLKG